MLHQSQVVRVATTIRLITKGNASPGFFLRRFKSFGTPLSSKACFPNGEFMLDGRTFSYCVSKALKHSLEVPHPSGSFGYPPPPPPPSISYEAAVPPVPAHSQEMVVAVPQRRMFNFRAIFSFVIGCIILSCIFTAFQVFTIALMSEYRNDGSDESTLSSLISKNDSPSPVDLDSLDVTFSTIQGCDEAKEELQDLVEFLKNPEKFTSLGARLPKGALLVGPPGCGKTLLAKAIAKEAGVSFFYAAASEFEEMFVGVGARRIREIFAAAKKASPAVVFIDEIDALAAKRTGMDLSSSRMSLNQLLAEMDGFQSNSAVIVIAATNTPEVLDKAITRPGRLDTIVPVQPPDLEGRASVLQLYLDKVRVDPSVKAMDIARNTIGFTGAELSNVVNIAAIRAATVDRPLVTTEDIEYARDRVIMGMESKKKIPEEDRRITAFHEGGHALAALLLKDEGADPVRKATIVPRGNGIMGLVESSPDRDVYSLTKKQCLAKLKVCFAGRVGEEMILSSGDVTTGASSDFRKAEELARSMVRNFGFSDRLGPIFFSPSNTPEGAYLSEESKGRIDDEVQKLLASAYEETKVLIRANEKKLNILANALLERETLSADEIDQLMKGKKLGPKKERAQRAPRKDVAPIQKASVGHSSTSVAIEVVSS